MAGADTTLADRPAARVDLPTSLVGTLLVLVLVALHIANPAVVEAFRLKMFDELQRLHPRPRQEAVPIAIVDIDDASLAEVGQWPWPRSTMGELVRRLNELGALVVTCDVLFAESDRYSPPVYAREVEALDPELAAALRELPDNDARMAAAMAGGTVVLGVAGIGTALDDAAGLTAAAAAAHVAVLGDDPRPFLPEFAGLVGALPALAEAAAGFGLVTLSPDIDGIVRRVPLVATVRGQLVPGLALETLRLLAGEDTLFVRGGPSGVREIVLGGATVPVDQEGRAWVRYGERDPAQYIPAREVLAGTVEAGRLDGHVVFVGASAAGLGDIKAAPIVGTMPGVEIQASLLQTLLSGSILRRPVQAVQLEHVALLVLGLILAWAGPFLRAGFLPPLLAVVVAGGLAATWYAFRYHEILVDGTYLAGALAVLLFWLAMARYVREEARRRTIRTAFSRYLSPVMVDRLASSARALRIGGERRELTVLFSDIRAFTTLSERYEDDPEGLTALLGRYFTAMTAVIQERSGTIDKYIGDAIMAFWNAPLPVERHARTACLAALGMRARLQELNEAMLAEAQERGAPFHELRIGIGLNTGVCFVGNMGSEQRFNYSVVGDPVNVASRLEGRCKGLAVDIVIGETTRAAAADLAALEVDRVRLVGKSAASRLFALVGDETCAASARFGELAAEHAAMLAAYRARDWDGALEKLRRCQHLGGVYGLAAFYDKYAARVEAWRAEPPPPDWDGSAVADSKR